MFCQDCVKFSVKAREFHRLKHSVPRETVLRRSHHGVRCWSQLDSVATAAQLNFQEEEKNRTAPTAVNPSRTTQRLHIGACIRIKYLKLKWISESHVCAA